jgi:hypothetical protein
MCKQSAAPLSFSSADASSGCRLANNDYISFWLEEWMTDMVQDRAVSYCGQLADQVHCYSDRIIGFTETSANDARCSDLQLATT